MSRFGWRRPRRSPRSAQRKPTEYALTVSNLEERTMLSLVSGVVADINQQVANSQTGGAISSGLTVLNGTMYFNANDGIHGTQLWKSDGTAAGTTMVTGLPQNGMSDGGPDPSSLVGFGGAIFFEVANSISPGPVASTIYRSDGTPGGASAIFTPDSSAVGMTGLVASGSSLHFLTTESGDSGATIDLWKSDGTSSGTAHIASIPAGQYSLAPNILTDANGTLFFTVDIGSTGTGSDHYQLWSSNGTAAGTTEVTALNGPLEGMATLGNKLVFAQPGPIGSPDQSLWLSDGTKGGTVLLHDFPPSANSGIGYVLSLTNSGGNLYFAALSGSDLQLWTTNGTVAGTHLLTTANDGSGGVVPSDLVDMGGKLYFLGNDAASGQRALWSSDGTTVGTTVIADLGGTEASYALGWGFFSNNDQLVASDNTLFVVGGNPSSPSEPDLWESDGTASGTTDLGSLPQTASTFQAASTLKADGATLFFTGTNAQGSELWYAKSSPTPTPPPPTPPPVTTPTPTPTPKPTPTPTAPKSPSPAPTSTVAPTIIGEQAIFHRRVNKRGKPVGRAVLAGFTLEFSRPMSASVLNFADYQLEEVRAKATGRTKLAEFKPVGLTVSYDTSSNTVTVGLAGKHAFAKGGVLAVNTALASTAGKSLGGNTTFAISAGAKSITPA
jgi:ELWxxDGT repeat protein